MTKDVRDLSHANATRISVANDNTVTGAENLPLVLPPTAKCDLRFRWACPSRSEQVTATKTMTGSRLPVWACPSGSDDFTRLNVGGELVRFLFAATATCDPVRDKEIAQLYPFGFKAIAAIPGVASSRSRRHP